VTVICASRGTTAHPARIVAMTKLSPLVKYPLWQAIADSYGRLGLTALVLCA
jgi:hypothetical protein